ncbi:MAG: hypothetical protein LIQ31_14720 [Planctomycetes bacterium]|nr:hypothetical protein [Planctomycetota bacterium]
MFTNERFRLLLVCQELMKRVEKMNAVEDKSIEAARRTLLSRKRALVRLLGSPLAAADLPHSAWN